MRVDALEVALSSFRYELVVPSTAAKVDACLRLANGFGTSPSSVELEVLREGVEDLDGGGPDREDRLAFRGIKGSVLQQACKIGLSDLAFHSDDLEATLVYARENSPAHIDQEPPKASAEQALLDDWAVVVMAKHFETLVMDEADGGFGIDKESVSRSGYFVPAPGRKQAPVSTTPNRLSDFLNRRSAGLPSVPRTGGSTPLPRARSPDDGAGVGIDRGYEPYKAVSPAGSAKSSGSNLTVATEAQVVGMMNIGLGRKTARALVAVGVVDESSLRSNTFDVIAAGLDGYLRSRGKEELSLIERNSLSSAMQKRILSLGKPIAAMSTE